MNQSELFLDQLKGMVNIPDDVINRAKQSFADYLAVTCAGARFQQEKLKKYMEFAQPEAGEYTAVGMRKRLVMDEAVFLNGLNSHALDFDDGTNSGIIHLGSPIFSLLIPFAQRYDIRLDKMLWAAVIGYEASYTMAVSIQPAHKALGFHATGTCGTLGAVIAASYMLDFSAEERFNAFAAACASASGMLMVLDGQSQLKPYNVAKTALMALSALKIAKAGFVGNEDPLGGYRGFFKMMTGTADIELKPVLLNGTYAIQKTYTKPYASCRYTHPSVEAAIRLKKQYAIEAQSVDSIEIETYSLAVSGHDHTVVSNPYSAKMSIPYSVAAGLMFGKAGLQEFSEERVKEDAILALTQKVRVSSDDEMSMCFPTIQSARVTVSTRDGSFSERVDYPKGEPENPLSKEEFDERYKALMTFGGVSEADADKMMEMIIENQCLIEDIVKNI